MEHIRGEKGMQVQGFGATDIGLKRDVNEDSMLLVPELGLYIVCDGMGGHAAGEVASQLAIETVERVVREAGPFLDGFTDSPDHRRRVAELIDRCVQEACNAVYSYACEGDGRAGMGTTLIMLLFVGDKAIMAHVGDSRLYLKRGKRLHQLSEDHNFANEFVKRGMPREQAKMGALSNRLTRAVGTQPSVKVDKLILDILPGDRFLLCSDGISGYFPEKKPLNTLMSDEKPSELPKLLVQHALEHGGQDNCTAVVLEVVSDDDSRAADIRHSTEVGLRLDVLNDVALFANLSMPQVSELLASLEMIKGAPDEVIIREGEAGDSLYIVLEGELAIERGGVELARISAGTHFGEMSLFNQRPRSASVRALTYTRLFVMHRDTFVELVKSKKELGVKLLWNIGSVLSERLDDFGQFLSEHKAPRS